MTVATAPVVTTQPVSQNYTSGELAHLHPGGQWHSDSHRAVAVLAEPRGDVDQPRGGRVDDVPRPVRLNALENHWEVRAVFTNSAGSANSNSAEIALVSATAPVVTTQPVSRTRTSGSSLTFTSAASGTPTPTVQWQVLAEPSGGSWTNLAGATSTT